MQNHLLEYGSMIKQ